MHGFADLLVWNDTLGDRDQQIELSLELSSSNCIPLNQPDIEVLTSHTSLCIQGFARVSKSVMFCSYNKDHIYSRSMPPRLANAIRIPLRWFPVALSPSKRRCYARGFARDLGRGYGVLTLRLRYSIAAEWLHSPAATIVLG